ncbi:MAG: DNA-processing protein DprA [Candidatus Scatomorpha sp.]|jgi:DNA processing protein
MSELKYWLWLSSLTGVRSRTKRLLLERYGGVREVYFAPRGDYAALIGLTEQECSALENKSFDRAHEIMRSCEELGVDIKTIQDADYPRRLAAIYDPPAVLYVRGRLPVVDEKAAIAVVGTRRASPYGLKMAARLGYEITRCGGLVISGLTTGVDVTAAQGALMAGGSCIGVLGSPIDDLGWGGETAKDVAAVGAVISEHPPGSKRYPGYFRTRNRITAGLSVAAVVVEAPRKSGALLFADEAASQGKEVFAVPANADCENAAGGLALIMDGAVPVTSGWDVLCGFAGRFSGLHDPGQARKLPESYTGAITAAAAASLPPEEPEKPPAGQKDVDKPQGVEYIDLRKQLEGLTEAQLAIVTALERPSTHIDDVIERTGLPAQEVLSELTMLQISGLVRQEPGKRFTLNISQK